MDRSTDIQSFINRLIDDPTPFKSSQKPFAGVTAKNATITLSRTINTDSKNIEIISSTGAVGNANVPSEGLALMTPPQAFVDACIKWLNNAAIQVDVNNCGLEYFNSNALLPAYAFSALTNPSLAFVFNFSNNKLTSANVNSILADLVGFIGSTPGTIDLSGPDMGAPTGAGITNKDTLVTAGWTVVTN